MENNKKNKLWVDIITFLIGFQIANNMNTYLGFKTDEIFSLLFAKSIGIMILCFIPVHFLVLASRDIWEKKRSDKLILIIMITFAGISIILSAISIIVPTFLYVNSIVFICFGIINLLNGIKQLKENARTIGKILIGISIALFFVALIEIIV